MRKLIFGQIAPAVKLARRCIPRGVVLVHVFQRGINCVAVHTLLAQLVANGLGAARAEVAAVVQPVAGKLLVVQVVMLDQPGNGGRDCLFVKTLFVQIALNFDRAAGA